MELTNDIFLIGEDVYQRVFDRNFEATLVKIETPRKTTRLNTCIYN
ncbi:MAG: hypothetical protein ACTSWX_08655 [Promethearchaeota archaeon]